MARPKRSSRTLRSKKSEQAVRRRATIGVALISIVALALVAIGYFRYTKSNTELDPDTGCPKSGPTSVTALIIDESDTIEPRQQAFLIGRMDAIKNGIPLGGVLEVYGLGTDMESLLTPVLSVCNPGRGAEVNSWTGSQKRAEKLWHDGFNDRLQTVFDRMLAPEEADMSPIMESIQSVNITSLSKPGLESLERRLILVSDMIQFTPMLNQYRGATGFDSFQNTDYYAKVRTNLRGVDVTIFYIPRARARSIQGSQHLDFWRDYFFDQGARPGRPALFVHVEG